MGKGRGREHGRWLQHDGWWQIGRQLERGWVYVGQDAGGGWGERREILEDN